ncbi:MULTISPECIES: aminotransferase class V-fold PLP-dependent enzyme [Dehalobacter]|uniref:cysteine desulfurase n=1 Tax=Dehalobacter restrictus TaxID=55583 RepID=A0A857DF94_9FIRM|nr:MULTISPECIES: aminotransferase class V-fold PLP-dependent enzyme [Dehalobacter]QGZ99191.1 aminotransferase class V-fold PLP-dependent enzyme [Dehalobacter restrictus]
MIYLDHAATSFHKPPEVAKAVYRALQGIGNSGRGAHSASLDASRLVYHTREVISELFNVGDPSRVVFTCNATESLNLAIQGLLKSGEHCITTAIEHNSVLRPLYLMEERGVHLTVVPADAKGCIGVSQIEAAVRTETKAVVLTHASNVTGNVLDIEAVSKICSKHNLLFIVDASQSAGIIPINMQKIGISALCCSGHKSLLGPQGTGVLCLADGVFPAALKLGGTGVDSFSRIMPKFLPAALEAGTLNTHGLAGLLAACNYLKTYGQLKILKEATELAKLFEEGIKNIPGINLYGDFEAALRTPVVALNVRDIDSGEITDELFQRFGIATRAGAHCAPEVHRTFGTEEQGMVRFSFSHFNTKNEVKEAITALKILEEESR